MVIPSKSLPGEDLSDTELQLKLRRALELPSQNRAVAEWLFDVHGDACRAYSATIPPIAFTNSLAAVSETRSIPTQDSTSRLSNNTPIGEQSENMIKSFVVLIPLEEKDGIAFGYSFHIGVLVNEPLLPLRDVLRTTFGMVGKFALHRSKGEVLVYINNVTPNSSLLLIAGRTDDMRWTNSIFALPKRAYDYYNIPARCIGLTYYAENKVSSKQSRLPEPGAVEGSVATQVSGNVIVRRRDLEETKYASGAGGDDGVSKRQDPHLLYRMESTEGGGARESSLQNKSQGDNCDAIEERTEEFMAGSSGNEMLTLDKGRLIGSEAVERDFRGECVAELSGILFANCRTTMKRFMWGSSLEQREAPREVDMYSNTKAAVASEATVLRKFAARSYYADNLAVTTDMNLSVVADDEANEGRQQEE